MTPDSTEPRAAHISDQQMDAMFGCGLSVSATLRSYAQSMIEMADRMQREIIQPVLDPEAAAEPGRVEISREWAETLSGYFGHMAAFGHRCGWLATEKPKFREFHPGDAANHIDTAIAAAERAATGGGVMERRPDGPVSLQEALQLAMRAAELIDEATELLHQITTGRDYTCQHAEWRLPDVVTNASYRADKAARSAHMDIVCNYAGLIDTIEREIDAVASDSAE